MNASIRILSVCLVGLISICGYGADNNHILKIKTTVAVKASLENDFDKKNPAIQTIGPNSPVEVFDYDSATGKVTIKYHSKYFVIPVIHTDFETVYEKLKANGTWDTSSYKNAEQIGDSPLYISHSLNPKITTLESFKSENRRVPYARVFQLERSSYYNYSYSGKEKKLFAFQFNDDEGWSVFLHGYISRSSKLGQKIDSLCGKAGGKVKLMVEIKYSSENKRERDAGYGDEDIVDIINAGRVDFIE